MVTLERGKSVLAVDFSTWLIAARALRLREFHTGQVLDVERLAGEIDAAPEGGPS